MLKTNEIRINNLVVYKKGHISIIKGFEERENKIYIQVKGLKDNYIDGVYEITHFYGLDLTLPLLKSCKFKFPNKDLSVSYGIFNEDFHFYIGNYAKKIKYFHEIQNFYSDFAGKELNYSIK
jgi:hypothetical protein